MNGNRKQMQAYCRNEQLARASHIYIFSTRYKRKSKAFSSCRSQCIHSVNFLPLLHLLLKVLLLPLLLLHLMQLLLVVLLFMSALFNFNTIKCLAFSFGASQCVSHKMHRISMHIRLRMARRKVLRYDIHIHIFFILEILFSYFKSPIHNHFYDVFFTFHLWSFVLRISFICAVCFAFWCIPLSLSLWICVFIYQFYAAAQAIIPYLLPHKDIACIQPDDGVYSIVHAEYYAHSHCVPPLYLFLSVSRSILIRFILDSYSELTKWIRTLSPVNTLVIVMKRKL